MQLLIAAYTDKVRNVHGFTVEAVEQLMPLLRDAFAESD